MVYHFNPLDARTIGKLCEEHKVTLLTGTPSFIAAVLEKLRTAPVQDGHSLDRGGREAQARAGPRHPVHAGHRAARGLRLHRAFAGRGGECTQRGRAAGRRTIHGNRLGTVGLPLPGTAIKTVDPETGADLPAGAEGMIAVKGPQVMVGYLNRPEATAQVKKDGWYSTGDIGYLDPDGFLKITDRVSRFSKIAGEMVPHLAIESAILQATGVDENQVAVTGVPDPKQGERLCVLYTDLGMSPAEVQHRLTAGPLPKVWVPSPRDFIHVDEIPITSTGKVDLRRLNEIAPQSGRAERTKALTQENRLP